MAKTILLTWRNMLADAQLAPAVRRMADDEEKQPVTDSSAHAAAAPVLAIAPVKIKPLAAFAPRAAEKHRDNGFEVVYFDSAQDHPGVSLAVHLRARIPASLDERVKLYISGHGGIGCDFITDDTEAQRQTVDQLARLLIEALGHRATATARCSQTQINMVSCLFARSPNGVAESSPAAKLHRKLIDNGIFVELIGRTEAIVALPEGRATINEFDNRVNVPVYGKTPRFYQPKTSYTKVRHTAGGVGTQIIERRDYAGDTYVSSRTPLGLQLLWAERTIDRILRFIKTDAEGQMADPRHRKLAEIAERYSTLLRPPLLKANLRELLSSSSIDENKNFLLHRDTASKMFGSVVFPGWKPKSAVFVESLLAAFPQ